MSGRRTALRAAAKRGAKGVLDSHPRVFKNNRVFYELERARAYRHFGHNPGLTDRRDILDPLIEDGVVVVPDFLSRTEANDMVEAMRDTLYRARANDLDGYVHTVQPDILVRVAPIEGLVPQTREFFDHPVVRSVVDAYMSPRAVSYRREADYRFGESKVAQADLYHFDNWRPLVKAFLYLVDVDEDAAPFAYVPGTHRQEKWRLRHNIAYDAETTAGRFGHFFPQEMRALKDEFGWQDKICTGTAGTLILADLRGLHRGTPLKRGERVMLTNAFDLMSAALDGI